MKKHFYNWITNDKTMICFLFLMVLVFWFLTREKELFRFLDMILSALFGWGAGKAAANTSSGTKP
jgi:hypothetical protein